MSRRRKVVLGVYCLFGAVIIAVPLVMAVDWLFAVAMVCNIGAVVSAGVLIATWGPGKAAQEQTFRETYGSLDGARAALDLDALRTVRDTQGVIPAVRVVRHEHPAIPLAQAAEIVRSL